MADPEEYKKIFSGDTSYSLSISKLINNLVYIQEPYISKDITITKRVQKKQSKIFAQHFLPIKKEVKPQFKNNYKPNIYLNKHYHARNYK